MVGSKQESPFKTMKIVVDTNIVFSAILNSNNTIGDLILNSDSIFEFYSVSYLRIELERHKSKLLEISRLQETQIDEAKFIIYSKINFISEDQIPFNFWQSSVPIVRDVDMDDIAFVALTQYLEDAKLWTGDKTLLNGIKAKGFSQCLNTQELLDLRKKIE